jgi:glycosyltransferase involved in cell wall biosynthesis
MSCVFPPEPVVSALTSADVARELIKDGDSVTVVTSFPSRPGGKLYPGYIQQFRSLEVSPDYGKVIRCFTIPSSKSSLMSRFLENLSFGLSSALFVLTHPRPAAVYVNTWPIFASGLLTFTTKLRRIPMVLSVQDIYPESLALQNRLSSKHPIMFILKKLDTLIARSAKRVIVISREFAEFYRKYRGMKTEHLSVIPNWFDSKLISLGVNTATFRRRLSISEETFLMTYAGNIGVASSLETVLKAMSGCRDMHNLLLLIAGDGSQLNECKRLARDYSEGQVKFYSPWPVEETSVVLRSANLLVLPTRGKQSLASVPSKLITYMLAARPVVAQAVCGSETARVVQDSGCGWVVRPDQPKLLANQIRLICALGRSELERRGKAGRAYALNHFRKEVCLPKVIDIIRSVSANKDCNTVN